MEPGEQMKDIKLEQFKADLSRRERNQKTAGYKTYTPVRTSWKKYVGNLLDLSSYTEEHPYYNYE